MTVGGERQGLERAGSRDLGRGGNRGSRRQELVTIEVQVIATLLDLGGANRTREMDAKSPRESRESGVVPEETAPSGEPQAS